MKYIKQYQNFQEVNEKWYHNLLAGLMLLSPSITNYVNANNAELNKTELKSEDTSISSIKDIIEYIKENEKEFKNSKQMINQLDKLIQQYEDGEIDSNSMKKIASKFFLRAKNMKKPVLSTRHDDKFGFTKIGEIKTYEELVIKENPSKIYVDIYENTFFKSGTYELSNTNDIINNINDSLASIKKLGYKLEKAVIESSTDGQKLSNNLQKKLEKDGYKGDNSGLSEARNDEMKKKILLNTEIKDGQIGQEINYLNNGKKDKTLRYNKIILKIVKTEAGVSKEVKENIVSVYYKISDNKKRKGNFFDIFKRKKKTMKKTKGIDVNLNPKRFQKCFKF